MEVVKEEVLPEDEEDVGGIGEVISCSAEKYVGGKKIGVDALRFAMLRAADLELKPKATFESMGEIVSHEEIAGMMQSPGG